MSVETQYEPVIGLEIHVQLSTQTKMFCGCALSFDDPPNTHTCPVCLGLPGALPVLNERAVHHGVLIGLALGSEIAERSIFHRKNYFYPDLPKGYQISQYDIPLCLGGRLGEVRIHRVHLEEDAAKLTHLGSSGRIQGAQGSVVDYNRGGTPLVEIVTEPDLSSPAQAREWLGLLRTTLRRLGVSDVKMEEGSLRCDANVSIRPVGSQTLGTKTELKNMNSFRFIEHGVRAEIERQTALVRRGETVVPETLHYDPASGRLTPLRSKEEAHDYRYFPEPDLVPLVVDEAARRAVEAELPELPAARAERFQSELGLPAERARELAFRSELADFFESAVAAGATRNADARAIANWIGPLVERIGSDTDPAGTLVSAAALAELAGLVAERQITRESARSVLDQLVSSGGEPGPIVEREGLAALSGEEAGLAEIVARAIAADPVAAERLQSGNMKAVGPLVGFVMRETQGRADGGAINRLIRQQLGL